MRLGMERSRTSSPSQVKVATFTLVLPISRTAVTPFMLDSLSDGTRRPIRRLWQMKHLSEPDRNRRAVGMGAHDVPHVIPPAAHHRMVGQCFHSVVPAALQKDELDRGFLIEMNRIIGDACLGERAHELRPDHVMAPAIFRGASRVKEHLDRSWSIPRPRFANSSRSLSCRLQAQPSAEAPPSPPREAGTNRDQKSKSLMLSLVKMNGEPNRISLPLMTLSLPSLPASTEAAPGFSLPSATARIT